MDQASPQGKITPLFCISLALHPHCHADTLKASVCGSVGAPSSRRAPPIWWDCWGRLIHFGIGLWKQGRWPFLWDSKSNPSELTWLEMLGKIWLKSWTWWISNNTHWPINIGIPDSISKWWNSMISGYALHRTSMGTAADEGATSDDFESSIAGTANEYLDSLKPHF